MLEHEAFISLKQALTEVPVPLFSDFLHPFHLEIDAFDVGLGAALT